MMVSGVVLMMYRFAPDAFEAQSALPVASPAATSDTVAEKISAGGGKVTPVRYEPGQ
jgi:putative transposase